MGLYLKITRDAGADSPLALLHPPRVPETRGECRVPRTTQTLVLRPPPLARAELPPGPLLHRRDTDRLTTPGLLLFLSRDAARPINRPPGGRPAYARIPIRP